MFQVERETSNIVRTHQSFFAIHVGFWDCLILDLDLDMEVDFQLGPMLEFWSECIDSVIVPVDVKDEMGI